MDINDPCETLTLVADTSNRVDLGSRATYISVYNPAAEIAYVRTGNSTVVATTSHAWVPPGQAITFRKEAADTYLAAICAEGVTLNIQVGSGV